MTITVLDRRDGAAEEEISLSQLHDAADQVNDELLPCRVNNSDLWFAESPQDVEFAKALCKDCPVRALCLDGALERPRGRPRKNEPAWPAA
jgi:WhiB family redox-sensing transcriptional regulator